MNKPFNKSWRVKSTDGSIHRTAVSLPPHHYGNVYFNDEGVSVLVDELTAKACVETGLFLFHESPGDIHKTLVSPVEDKIEAKEDSEVPKAQPKAQVFKNK